MALRELLVSFDVDTAQAAQKLSHVAGKVEEAKSKLGALADAFIGSKLVGGLRDFIENQIAAAKETRLTAQKLGVSVDTLEEFSFAADAMGVSSEGAGVALKFLNKNIGLALEGNQEAVQTFMKMNVAIKDGQGNVRELGDMLPEIADSFAKMGSQQERTSAAMKIFGRQGADLLPLLMGGSKSIDELRERFHALGGGMSEDFIAKAKEAGRAIGGARFGFNAWKRAIAFEFFPVVTMLGQKLQTIVSFLQKFTRETNVAKYAAVALGIGASAAALKAAAGFAKLLGIMPSGAGFWKTVLGLGVWALVAIAVLGVFLIAEDLITLFTGGESAIGDFVDSLFGIGTAAEGVALFDGVVQHLRAVLDEAGPVWDSFVQSIDDLAGAFGVTLPSGMEFLRWMRDEFVEGIHTGISALESLIGALSRAATAFSQTIGALKSGDISVIGGIGESLLKAAASSPAAGTQWDKAPTVHTQGGVPTGTSTGAANVTQVNNVTNNISGVKDAQGAGQAAKTGTKDALGGELQNALGAAETRG